MLELLKPPTTSMRSMPSGVPWAPVSLYTASWRYCSRVEQRRCRGAGRQGGEAGRRRGTGALAGSSAALTPARVAEKRKLNRHGPASFSDGACLRGVADCVHDHEALAQLRGPVLLQLRLLKQLANRLGLALQHGLRTELRSRPRWL